MRFRKVIILQLFLVMVMTSGCRLMTLGWIIDKRIPLTDEEKDVADALRVHLAEDRWQQNSKWNLLFNSHPVEFDDRKKSRWKYGDAITEGFLTRIDQKWHFDNWSPREMRKARKKGKNEPVGKAKDISAAKWFLREISHDDTLSGWNATILFVLRADSRSYSSLKTRNQKTLERLVTQQLYYDADTGIPSTHKKKTISTIDNRLAPEGKNRQPPEEKVKLTASSSIEEYIQYAKQIEQRSPEKENEKKQTNRFFSFLQKKENPRPKQNIKPVSRFMRLAAAEAWCRMLAETDYGDDKAKALEPVGKVLKNTPLPDSIRAELILGLAPWIPPNRIPRLPESFSLSSDRNKPKTSLLLRRAAIEACAIHALAKRKERQSQESQADEIGNPPYNPAIWPKRIMNAQFDPDPRVRQLFGLWLVLSNHPQAFEFTKSQLADIEPQVRLAALENLGILHTPAALKLLNSRSHRKEMPIRKFALKGLAYWGSENLGRFSEDESAEVREALAIALKKYRDVSSASILQKLLSDRSQKVQLTVLDSIRDWHEAWSIPLLLHGMAEGTPRTSQRAFVMLQEKIRLTFTFPISSHVTVRREAVEKLAKKYNLPLVFMHDPAKPLLAQKILHSVEEKERLKEYVTQILTAPPESVEYFAASESLHALDSSSVSVLETVLEETHAENHTFFTQELLPELSELYRAVIDLEKQEPADRLRGIRVLEKHGMFASLSPMIVRRMLYVLKKGSDRTIWRSAMNAVMGDSLPLHAEVAKFGAHHFAPEIRILACRYFQRHRLPEFAPHLLELLEDHDYNVKLAAIEAAGYCPNPIIVNGTPGQTNPTEENSRGLTGILLESDRELRTSAALSLARMGNETGFQELIRASFHRDRKIQEDAFRKMGRSGRRRFVEHLVRRCWIEKHSATRIVILNSIESLVPVEERPSGLAGAKMYEEKAKVWSNWLDNRKGTRQSNLTGNNSRTLSPARSPVR